MRMGHTVCCCCCSRRKQRQRPYKPRCQHQLAPMQPICASLDVLGVIHPAPEWEQGGRRGRQGGMLGERVQHGSAGAHGQDQASLPHMHKTQSRTRRWCRSTGSERPPPKCCS